MNNALIGFTGFVGTTLLKQSTFNALYRSTNIDEIKGREFEVVVCAGAPAQKWLANKDPEQDRININNLIDQLKTITAKKFILISTVDVFKSPINVTEDASIDLSNLHAYGTNRYLLEEFVAGHFSDYLIVRLPGLVGPGLRKNIIFDFLNNNNVDQVDSRNVFQFYPMVNLWFDIEKAIANNIKLIHLTSVPISVSDISTYGFGIDFDNTLSNSPAHYNFKSKYADLYEGTNGYQYSKKDVIQAVRCYAQSEPKTIKGDV